MSRLRALVLLLLLATDPALAAAQRPSGPMWEAYHKGVEILRDAVDAHGGADRIAALTSVSYTWDGRDYFSSQGRRPAIGADTTGNGRPAMYSYSIDYKNNRFLLEGAFAFGGGWFDVDSPSRAPISFRVASDHKTAVSFDPSDPGSFFSTDTTGALSRSIQNRFVDMAPLVMIKRAMSAIGSIRYLGATVEKGRPHDAVQFIEGDDRPRVLYFDRATHLLTRVEKLGDGGSFGDEIDAVTFSKYEIIDGLQVPREAAEVWNEVVAGRFRLTKFAANADLPDDLTRVPAEFRGPPASGPALGLRMNRVATATYLVEGMAGGYRSLVVDTEEGVVVVEAPVSFAAAQAAIALIERTLPGRAIKYLVVTHHHADHRAGVRAYAERGVTVLVPKSAMEYITRRLDDPHTFNRLFSPPPSNLSRQIVAAPAERMFGAGDASVQIIDVGPTLHSDDMLVAYVPAAKLFFSGDLVFSNSRGAPSPSSREIADVIRKRQLMVDAMITVHGTNTTWAALDAATRR